jgi:hypothetical protein
MAGEDTAGWKVLAGVVVICELWRLAVVLQLLALTSRVYKWSINTFSNPNPVYSYTHYVSSIKDV